MKVFISSVRRGLEAERDSLPGVIRALGHDPKRFEDFTALPIPSREACLLGVDDADVYLLVLGEHYGDPLPDTGLSPTAEEWTRARTSGIPVIAFTKKGADFDDRQAAFAREVESYVEGRFRRSFQDVAELLTGVVAAIRALAEVPTPLEWIGLDAPAIAPWRESQRDGWGHGTRLECHVIPVGQVSRVAAAVLERLPERLARVGRDAGLFTHQEALNLSHNSDGAEVTSTDRSHPAGLAVTRNRTISVWSGLPSDRMGTVIDESDVKTRLAAALRLVASLALSESHRVALAVGLDGLSMANTGSVSELGNRSSTTMPWAMSPPDYRRVEATSSVPLNALSSAPDEIARELAKEIFLLLQNS